MARKTPTTSLAIHPVRVDELTLFDSFLSQGLAELYSKTSVDYTLSDLKEACTNQADTLFIIGDVFLFETLGFFVLSIRVIEDKIQITVSSGYAKHCNHISGLEFCLQKVEEFAIIVGATEVLFQSPRKGWVKVANKLGFSLYKKSNDLYYYSKEVIDHAISR
jgi:hypothetical protein